MRLAAVRLLQGRLPGWTEAVPNSADLEITEWLAWFLDVLKEALQLAAVSRLIPENKKASRLQAGLFVALFGRGERI